MFPRDIMLGNTFSFAKNGYFLSIFISITGLVCQAKSIHGDIANGTRKLGFCAPKFLWSKDLRFD